MRPPSQKSPAAQSARTAVYIEAPSPPPFHGYEKGTKIWRKKNDGGGRWFPWLRYRILHPLRRAPAGFRLSMILSIIPFYLICQRPIVSSCGGFFLFRPDITSSAHSFFFSITTTVFAININTLDVVTIFTNYSNHCSVIIFHNFNICNVISCFSCSYLILTRFLQLLSHSNTVLHKGSGLLFHNFNHFILLHSHRICVIICLHSVGNPTHILIF